MTLFEYLAIAYSLVFSFAALRLVAGLPHVLDAGRRYFVHVVYVCVTLFATAALFWSQWSAHDREWTLLRFLLHMAGPGMVYYLTCTLIPDEPSAVRSWQEYFFAVRRRYFGGLCLWAVLMVFNSTYLLDTPAVHPVRAVQAGVFALGIAGLSSGSPAGQRAVALLALAVVGLAIFVLQRPAPLAA